MNESIIELTDDMTELRRLKLRDPSPLLSDNNLITYIEIPIEKNDTLQGLSLKFSCKVIDIKRINNLTNDQDIYALNLCKIF